MMILFVNIVGLLLIVGIVWWFWLANRGHQVQAQGLPVDIRVEGGVYVPDTVEGKVGVPLQLRFLRKDPSPCAETVVFNELDVSQNLPLDQKQIVQLTVEQAGDYEFTCPMGMYRGKIRVLE